MVHRLFGCPMFPDEFDFRTTLLARDLRDGVRLARLADILIEV